MYYCYNEPIFDQEGVAENIIVRLTREEVLSQYWDYWKEEMKNASRRLNKPEMLDQITEDNCIEDWLQVNWGWIENNT